MIVPKLRVLTVAAFALVAAGCSSGASVPSPSPTPPPASTSSAAPSPTATSCPSGGYVITTIEGHGSAAALKQGTGGNITADFTDGTLTIASDGSVPTTLDVGLGKAELRFNGQITGTYAGDPTALQLTTTGATGEASVKGFGLNKTFSATQLSDQLVGSGTTAQVTCDDGAGTAVVTLPNATLTLARR